ncbi:MAG: 50S ribosomal protein L21 [SAR202 cluster bacterium]|nr:50S ribosomal protein L21 [SAR202 cluster bacterium]
MSNYAIVQTGGKQYRVETGDTIRVESLPVHTGELIDVGEVLAVSQDGDITIGTPTVEGAKVRAQVLSQGRDKKIVVFKYKNKTRYRRKTGHRQTYTEIKITDITV